VKNAMTRSGLPRNEVLIYGDLDPSRIRTLYRQWLATQNRSDDIPPDTLRFVNWWADEEGEATHKPVVPWAMDRNLVIAWWIVWCGENGRERLVPFDLRRFLDWWQEELQATRDDT